MKVHLLKLLLVLSCVGVNTTVLAQMDNVIMAVMEMRKLNPEQNISSPANRKALLTAKKLIDQAARHPETQTAQKMLWHRGEIYYSLALLITYDAAVSNLSFFDAFEESLASYEQAWHSGPKYSSGIRESVEYRARYLSQLADILWEKREFASSGTYYRLCAVMFDTIGVLQPSYIYNAGLAFEQAQDYRQAAEMFDNLVQLNHNTAAMGIRAMQAYSKIGDRQNAIQVLQDAIAKEPFDARLHYGLGTLYMEMNSTQEAESAILRSLELDPAFTDARYQLGALHYNWSLTLTEQASSYVSGHPQQLRLKSEADAKMHAAVQSLEIFIQSRPNDKNVLAILIYALNTLGDHQRAAIYKARADAL